MLNLYITSSEKHSGKTFLTAGLAGTMQSLGFATSVYKPIQTSGIEINGFMQSPDLTYVKTVDPYINTHFSYLYKEKTEPILAAEADNEVIDLDYVLNEYNRIIAVSDCTIIDGDCGILSPIGVDIQTSDLIKKLNIPILIATTPNENSINNTLLTIFAAQEKGIEIRGVILNNIQKDCPKNLLTSIPRLIEEFTDVKVLGLIPQLKKDFLPEDLIPAILNGVDIESIFNVKIEKLDMK